MNLIETESYLTKSNVKTIYVPKMVTKRSDKSVQHIVPASMKRAERKVRSTLNRAHTVTDWDEVEMNTTARSYRSRQAVK